MPQVFSANYIKIAHYQYSTHSWTMQDLDEIRKYYELYLPQLLSDGRPVYIPILTPDELFGDLMPTGELNHHLLGGLEKRLSYDHYRIH